MKREDIEQAIKLDKIAKGLENEIESLSNFRVVIGRAQSSPNRASYIISFANWEYAFSANDHTTTEDHDDIMDLLYKLIKTRENKLKECLAKIENI